MACIFCNCQEEKKVPDDFVVYGYQFESSTDYVNPFLKGRYRLSYRGIGDLIGKVEWEYLEGGGFRINPPLAVANESIFTGEFY